MGELGDCLTVRCKVCNAYAYHDQHFGLTPKDYTCKRCESLKVWREEKGNDPFECCEELQRLRIRVKDLEAIIVSFAENQK